MRLLPPCPAAVTWLRVLRLVLLLAVVLLVAQLLRSALRTRAHGLVDAHFSSARPQLARGPAG